MNKNDHHLADPVTWLSEYGNDLFCFARSRVRDSFTAEDLVQETLLAAYRSFAGFSGKSSLKTWLIGILKHKIIDHYRKCKPEHSDDTIDDFSSSMNGLFDKQEKWSIKPENWGHDPKNLYERQELMSVINACLNEMPKRMSQAYTLRELDGASTDELCDYFQTGKNNIGVIMYRARMLLRRCLEVNWFGSNK